MDLDVRALALEARAGLVDEDARVGQRGALAVGTAGEDQRAARHRDPEAGRGDVGADEAHRVVNRERGAQRAAGGVDVDVDVLLGVVGLEMHELGDDEVGELVVDRLGDEDDPLAQQPGVDVEGPLAAGSLLDDHRNQWRHIATSWLHNSATVRLRYDSPA